jgi:hypothetical protein
MVIRSLSNSLRTYCDFDCDNPQHRMYFDQFLRTRSWKDCPVRFFITDRYQDCVTMIQAKLLHYYLDKEFKEKT